MPTTKQIEALAVKQCCNCEKFGHYGKRGELWCWKKMEPTNWDTEACKDAIFHVLEGG